MMPIAIGFLIGFIASVPVGPINLLAITQVMRRDFLHGFLVGLTTAFLDGLYSYLALIGISHLAFNLDQYISHLKIMAVSLLILLGMRMLYQARKWQERREKSPKSIHRPILASLILYITNPALYGFWLAAGSIVTTHRMVSHAGFQPLEFSVSCAAGSLTWYFILTKYVDKYHHQFSAATFRKIFYGVAMVLFVFAAYTIYTLK